jgi:sortase (surface protein transpeptidase)
MSQTSTKNTSFTSGGVVRQEFGQVRTFLLGKATLPGENRTLKYRQFLQNRRHHAQKTHLSGDEVVVFTARPISIPRVEPPVVRRSFSRYSARKTTLFQRFARTTLGFVVLVSLLSFGMIFGPWAYSKIVTIQPIPQEAATEGTPLGGNFTSPAQPSSEQTAEPSPSPMALPPRDETLPEGNWVMIPRIGVRTEILESEVAEASLEKGVWRVPEFAQPGDHTLPMILAAHRYGYKWWWNSDYWQYHSFNKLPDLEPGDLVEIIADKRKYTYEVYAGEMTTEITDYHADVILYTCKYLNAPQRYVKYARYIPPGVNTQDTQLSTR